MCPIVPVVTTGIIAHATGTATMTGTVQVHVHAAIQVVAQTAKRI